MQRPPGQRRQWLLVAVSAFLVLPSVCQGQSTANNCDDLAQKLLGSLAGVATKGIVVMDLKDPEDRLRPFGSWFADQLSASLAKQAKLVEVIERDRLRPALQERSLSLRDEFDPKTAVTLGRAVGAQTVIIGSYGALGTDIGVTLNAVRISGNESDFVVACCVRIRSRDHATSPVVARVLKSSPRARHIFAAKIDRRGALFAKDARGTRRRGLDSETDGGRRP